MLSSICRRASRVGALRMISSGRNGSSGAGVLVDMDRDTGVATLTLSRPKSLNAMTVQLGEEFAECVSALRLDDDLRCVVVTGAGRAFSAGGDLQFILGRKDVEQRRNAEEMRMFYERFLSIRHLAVPTIAAVNGPAIGAGMCLAMACDMRFADTKSAKLGATFINLGIHPGMGSSFMLPRLVNPQLAFRMLLTGEVLDAESAAGHGLVMKSDSALDDAQSLARRIALQSPHTVRLLTRNLRFQLYGTGKFEESLWREADAQAEAYGTDDFVGRVSELIQRTASKKEKNDKPNT